MDPSETLKRIRELTQEMADTRDPDAALVVAASLADHIQALDEWLTNGGYLPNPWGAPVVKRVLQLADSYEKAGYDRGVAEGSRIARRSR